MRNMLLAARLPAQNLRSDRGVALLSVLMLMLVVAVLGIVVMGAVLTQSSPTLATNKHSRTLAAAQAGLDAAASQIRNAESPDSLGELMGNMHMLPCTVEGFVDGTEETSYVATVQYFSQNPEGQDDQWREDEALTCYTGTGSNGGVRSVPRWAIITSEGFDDTATASEDRADRIVEVTYTFQLTTRRLNGGRIFIANDQFCAVATSTEAGAEIRFRSILSDDCKDETDVNLFSWAEDYMIHLSYTDRDGRIPLCLSGRPSGAQNPAPMTLQPCTTTDQDPLGQRFAWMSQHTWRGQNAANTAEANAYIVNQDSTVHSGDRLSVATSAGNPRPVPAPAVGKGNASYDTEQAVNYAQFGRCLDVTNGTIGYEFMIAYPCKQDPSGGMNFDWNHKWYYDEPAEGEESTSTKITVRPGSTHCLISPSSGPYPRFLTGTSGGNIDCSSNRTDWVRYGYSEDLTQAYTFQDLNGRCLSIAPDDKYNDWSKIVVETCDGSDLQKWNHPDTPVDATMDGFTELTGRASD